MSFYVVSHKVEDFTTWKKIYDGFESTREEFGVKEMVTLQSVDDQNHVLVVGEGDLSAIQSFLNSDSLKEGMKNAGVSSEPNLFIGENVK